MTALGLARERLERLLLPETLIFLGLLAFALLMISVVVRVKATYRYDLAATLWLQRLESPLLTKLALAATTLGNASTLVALAAIGLVSGWATRRLEAGIILAASLVALPINAIWKNVVDRQRPGQEEAKLFGGPRWSFSFPSGHAMGTAAFYGTLAALLWVAIPNGSMRVGEASFLFLLPALCGLSRIYLGAHWLSDVVAGWTAGATVALAAVALYGQA